MPHMTRWYIDVSVFDDDVTRLNALDSFDYRAPITGPEVARRQIRTFVATIVRRRAV